MRTTGMKGVSSTHVRGGAPGMPFSGALAYSPSLSGSSGARQQRREPSSLSFWRLVTREAEHAAPRGSARGHMGQAGGAGNCDRTTAPPIAATPPPRPPRTPTRTSEPPPTARPA